MVGTIHIVASCASRKSAKTPTCRQLRDVENAEPEHRARSWWDRLQVDGAERVRARDLYAGSHWTAVEKLPAAVGPVHRVVPWVASAGYGLVSWDAELVAYSATFASGQPDSVDRSVPAGMSRSLVLGQWWKALSDLPGPQPAEPRTIEAIAAADPFATILVVASPPYIRAMEEDLCKARDLLYRSDQLAVISNGAKLASGPLANNVVPVGCRALAIVKGAMTALNARVALALLSRVDATTLGARALRDAYGQMTRDASAPELSRGAPMSDEQILGFIREQLVGTPGVGHSSLLRLLRGRGGSCGQDRFRELYRRVIEVSRS
jgi:hypothetical protein